MIRRAFNNWPESHRFTPTSSKHLRKWLIVKAGYYTVHTIDLAEMPPVSAAIAISAAMKKPFGFTVPVKSKLHVLHAASISFDELPHLEACALFDAVADVIAAEIGIPIGDVLPTVAEPKPSAREQLVEAGL
jgi:hypothetical protein